MPTENINIVISGRNILVDVTGGRGPGLPSGGTAGQIPVKVDGTDYNIVWDDIPSGLPAGGTTGQSLIKTDGTDYNVEWAEPASRPWIKDGDLTANSSTDITKDDDIYRDGNVTLNGTLFSNLSAPLTGVPTQYVFKIKALTDTHSFNFSKSAVNPGTGIYNNVFMCGWNLDPNGQQEEAGKSAIGFSFEDNYEPNIGNDIAEHHIFFVSKAGVQRRLTSYTIYKDEPGDWERYNTLAKDYHKSPVTDYVWNRFYTDTATGNVSHKLLDSKKATETGVEIYMDSNQYLYGITPINFKTAANQIWYNQFNIRMFGQLLTAGFEVIKYQNVVNFIFTSDLPVYASNAAAITGGLPAKSMYRTSTGELRLVY